MPRILRPAQARASQLARQYACLDAVQEWLDERYARGDDAESGSDLRGQGPVEVVKRWVGRVVRSEYVHQAENRYWDDADGITVSLAYQMGVLQEMTDCLQHSAGES